MFLDLLIYKNISAIHSNFFDDLFLFVTSFGKWQIVLLFILALSIYFYKKSEYKWMIVMYLSFALSTLTTVLIKFLVLRPRPLNELLIEDNFSFPSGHATVAAVFYTFIFYYLYKHAKTKFAKSLSVAVGILLVALIAFSRIYLQVHYFSDVFVGLIIGLLGFVVARKLLRV